jgi:glycosyltransferase involved in cell wall biosynthesis
VLEVLRSGRLALGPMMERFERALAERLGVGDRLVLRGRVGRDEMPALMRSADAVVCVPWYEPFGIVPLEAMACGVPVVASAVGGLADSVVHGSTGLLVPPRDPVALAGAAGHLLARPELRTMFGLAGRRRARRWYDWARVAAQTEAVYLRLAGGRPGAAGAGDGTLAVGVP